MYINIYPISHGKVSVGHGVRTNNIAKPLKKHPLNKGHFAINDT